MSKNRPRLSLGNDVYTLDTFTRAYIEGALWSSIDENGTPLDKDHGPKDIDPATFEEMVRDARVFQMENGDFIPAGHERRAGLDFWLTRNGHGAGFWDGDWPERISYRLTKSAESYGEYTLYVDDGKIYGA